MSIDWNIQAPACTCTACQKTFADGDALFSLLQFGAEGYARHDYCTACWGEKERAGATGVWQGVFRAPPPPPDEPLKKETAESLLRHMMETEDERHGNAIYILAIMLERRRILVERDIQTRDDGMKIRVYEHKQTHETFFIPDPQLKLAELTHVQEEVVLLLGGSPLRTPKTAPQAAPPTAPKTEAKAEAKTAPEMTAKIKEKAATDEHGSNTEGV